MLPLSTLRRLLLGRFLTRSFVAVLAFAVLLPMIACLCSDGREVLFCVPGACGRCAIAPKPNNGHSCCARHSASSCCRGFSTGETDVCGLSARNCCCQLVIHAPTVAAPFQGFQAETSQAIGTTTEPMPGLLAAVCPDWIRPFNIEGGPPPIDLVIAQRCLTL
jgi:hypothetical protein